MQDQQRARVVDTLPLRVVAAHIGAVDPGLNGAHRIVVPSLGVEFRSGSVEPHQIRSAGRSVSTREELLLTQGRRASTNTKQPRDEGDEFVVGGLPVECPRICRGRVLRCAVRVVVTELTVSQLVSGEQHRSSGRQYERSQQRAHMPCPIAEDVRIIGRALDTMVDRYVVVGPVPILFTVGLVVLAGVGDQIGDGESVVCRDEVDRRPGKTAAWTVEVL